MSLINKNPPLKKSLLTVALSLALLSGCDNGTSNHLLSEDVPSNPGETPSPEPKPEPPGSTLKTGYLTLGNSQVVTGKDIFCNNLPSKGFSFTLGETISCKVGNTIIATFDTKQENQTLRNDVDKISFNFENANEFNNNETKKDNALFLITKSNSCSTSADQLCLDFRTSTERVRFEKLYADIHLEQNEFKKKINEELSYNSATNKAPSTHTSPIIPVTTPGASPDINASFVSANAERFYQYQPSELILSKGFLVDSIGNGIAGINYYTPSGNGVTGENGQFSFNWGEDISFGIETFELGSVRGNKSTIMLSELGDEVRGSNIEQLITRYSTENNDNRVIPDIVRTTFAQYPNEINNIINLSLSNGKNETQNKLPNEFLEQFKNGLAKDIDTIICKTTNCNSINWLALDSLNINEGAIQADINKLWGIDKSYKPVNKFHIFHDSTNFYSSTGQARAQAVINTSNSAFPIMMARNDLNYWLAFGEKRTWDKNGLAYITEAPSIVVPENVNKDSSTFNLPFISLGQVGSGKLMVIGNPHYNSILRCPNGYSWGGSVNNKGECTLTSDSDDMKNFMQNVLRYLTEDAWTPETKKSITVGTNISNVYFKRHGQVTGDLAKFELHKDFSGIQIQQLTNYASLDPNTTPLLILNGFEYLTKWNNGYAIPLSADISKPKLTQKDVSDIIAYMDKGGSVLIMENVMGKLTEESTSSFVRLLDSAGLSMSLNRSVVTTAPAGYPNRPRQLREKGIWVYERYPVTEGKKPYTIDKDGKVIWTYQAENKPDDKPKLEVASWLEDVNGKQQTQYAFIDIASHKTQESLNQAKQKILNKFEGLKECQDSSYHYEINCLEYRPGTNIPITGDMYVPRFTEISLGEDTAKAMLQAADLGTNIERLYQHELYFRTKGKKGERLNSTDLERLYQNMSVWLWNDITYSYDPNKEDELGFKTFTEFLNCYANGAYTNGTSCSNELKQSLVDNNMIFGEKIPEKSGMMNPSYPLNYMEKPLTRLMLGRSWWDLNIKVDTEKYPGKTTQSGESITKEISLYANPTKWFAGNMQSTGLWAPAQQDVTITSQAKTAVTITVALADDLTGREKHEVSLNRPPRVTKNYQLAANKSVTFKVPYGGLIYVQGNSNTSSDANEKFTFNGVVKAPYYKEDQWVHDKNSPAPLGEIESKSFIYTTPKKNLDAINYNGDVSKFTKELDMFADSMNNFYARNEESGNHRMITYNALIGHKHRFTNDVQISIGDAHSGYPVMNSSFSINGASIPTTPLNDWLLWHEVGHNAAEAPLNLPGATEVVNNVLALYMQDRYLGKMSRVEQDITAAPDYLKESGNQAWAKGGAGDRLLMYAQLKEWAEHNFDITTWYDNKDIQLPNFYSMQEGMKGWNLFQLMHRKARGDSIGETKSFGSKNYCAEPNGNPADTLMLCASWLTQTDLSEFFKLWNPGATAYQLPGASSMNFEGGVSESAYKTLAGMNLKKPESGPEKINKITIHSIVKN